MASDRRGAGKLGRNDPVQLHRHMLDRGFPLQVLERAPDPRPGRRSAIRSAAVPLAFSLGIGLSYVVTAALTVR
jgi:hypothetical protein